MIRLGAWLSSVSLLFLLWHECGDDFGIFCYRIGIGVFSKVRSRALALAPALQLIPRPLPRNRAACSNRSAICSTQSMMSKD